MPSDVFDDALVLGVHSEGVQNLTLGRIDVPQADLRVVCRRGRGPGACRFSLPARPAASWSQWRGCGPSICTIYIKIPGHQVKLGRSGGADAPEPDRREPGN